MKQSLSLKCSSFTHDADLYMPTGFEIPSSEPNAWRAITNSITCLMVDGKRTGYAHVGMLEQYVKATGILTGATKVNSPNDANYIPNYLDNVNCAPENPNGFFHFNNTTNQDVIITISGKFTGYKLTVNVAAHDLLATSFPFDTFNIAVACPPVANSVYDMVLENPLTIVIDQSYLTIDDIQMPANVGLNMNVNPQ